MRVARVTPSLIINSPSFPSVTSSGGIPAVDTPNRRYCSANLTGSAPLLRDGGNLRLPGSTIRISSQAIIAIADPAKRQVQRIRIGRQSAGLRHVDNLLLEELRQVLVEALRTGFFVADRP